MDTVTIPEPISPVKDFLSKTQKLLIDGKRVDASSGETFEVADPSTNTILTRVPKGGKEDINLALKLQETLSKTVHGERLQYQNEASLSGN